MGDGTSTRATRDSLPARVVVRLDDLSLISESRATSLADDNAATLDGAALFDDVFDIFARDGAIIAEVVPALRRREVWRGELSWNVPGLGNGVIETLWVPHLNDDRTPSHTTVLIGAGAQPSGVAPDPLTELPTRVVLLDRLAQSQRRARRSNGLLALLFLDLDGLKQVNDRHGHEEGDKILRHTAHLLRSCMRDGDTVARFGGDEFIVLCEELDGEEGALAVAHRILDVLRADDDYPLSTSIGIAFDRGGVVTALQLVGRADAAMYRAKDTGGGRVEVFDAELQGRIEADQTLRQTLLTALAHDGVGLAAQPLFRLATGSVLGVELFARVPDGRGALISAHDVFRLASDQSASVDRSMIGLALDAITGWRTQLQAATPRIHVNVSAQSLGTSGFVSWLGTELYRRRIPPRLLALEIDSYQFDWIHDVELAALDRLRSMGIGVAIDGYGVGPANPTTVNRVQPMMVKIAARDETTGDPLPTHVIMANLRAIAALGVIGCVKGIEDPTLLARISASGAFAGQGNVLSSVGPLDVARDRVNQERIGY